MVVIELPDEIAAGLTQAAEQRQMSVSDYLGTLVKASPPERIPARFDHLPYDKWLEKFEEYRRTRRTDLPVLSDEDISRESIYEGR